MTWRELRAASETALAAAGVERPARLVLDWFDDIFGRASRRADEAVPFLSEALARQQLEELITGRPLAYVTGFTHFYGYELEIGEGVLIPRPETEELVRWIEESHGLRPSLRFADLCTGSGCIAIALARRHPTWTGVAVDVSPHAVSIAERNTRKHNLASQVEVLQANLFTYQIATASNPVDLIVSNPPYIPESDWGRVAASVADYEPHLALRVSDAAPLNFYSRILEIAEDCLALGGWVYFECNDRFASDVEQLMVRKGYGAVKMLTDMQGCPRHVRGQRDG